MIPLLSTNYLGISIYCLSKLFHRVICSTSCLSYTRYLEMYSDSTNKGEVSHYAYVVLKFFPLFPTEITVLCHHAEINDSFLPSGRVGPSPFT